MGNLIYFLYIPTYITKTYFWNNVYFYKKYTHVVFQEPLRINQRENNYARTKTIIENG